jgi:hypothetical protein
MDKPIHLPGTFALPFKYHADHRHRVPKARYRITNWAEYDASLRQRGSLTIWLPTRRSRLGGRSREPRQAANRITLPLRSARP